MITVGLLSLEINDLTNLIFSSRDVFKLVSVDNQVDVINIYVQSQQKMCLSVLAPHTPRKWEITTFTEIHSYAAWYDLAFG